MRYLEGLLLLQMIEVGGISPLWLILAQNVNVLYLHGSIQFGEKLLEIAGCICLLEAFRTRYVFGEKLVLSIRVLGDFVTYFFLEQYFIQYKSLFLRT